MVEPQNNLLVICEYCVRNLLHAFQSDKSLLDRTVSYIS